MTYNRIKITTFVGLRKLLRENIDMPRPLKIISLNQTDLKPDYGEDVMGKANCFAKQNKLSVHY